MDPGTAKYWRHRRKTRRSSFLLLAGFYLTVCGAFQLAKFAGVKNEDLASNTGTEPHHISKRSVIFDLSENETEENCTPRTVEEFPKDFLTLEEKQDGLIFIHILIAMYCFAILAIVCDDYFVSSLEHICSALKLSPDVAGATFMASGSSAPELATSVISVFFAESDVGIGTIVGSAVFNVLVIVALCALFAGMVVRLEWWPLVRDCVVYGITVAVLIVVIYDTEVHWYEALIMIMMYILYIVIMWQNPRLSHFFVRKVETLGWYKWCQHHDHADEEKQSLIGGMESEEKTSDHETSFLLSGNAELDPRLTSNASTEDDDDYESPLTIPDKFLKRVFWVLMLPMTLLLLITIPDCRRAGVWKKLYFLTFIMSIVWIIGVSYVMVWMVVIIGDTWEIPDTVMGLTFLAAGTSVPDALASLFAAQDGFGDMAVSNTVGSNIFDILLCLGLPWFISTLASDKIIIINSKTLVFTGISLFATVVYLLLGVAINGWKLNRRFGIITTVVYAVFMVFSILYETNVFTDINLPMCPRN